MSELVKYLPYIGIAYALTVNLAAGAAVLSDKRRAERREWRTPEKAFYVFALAGGGIGVLAGFMLFRHKTRHTALILGVLAVALAVYAGVIAGLSLLS